MELAALKPGELMDVSFELSTGQGYRGHALKDKAAKCGYLDAIRSTIEEPSPKLAFQGLYASGQTRLRKTKGLGGANKTAMTGNSFEVQKAVEVHARNRSKQCRFCKS